jgi:hypothetical protein
MWTERPSESCEFYDDGGQLIDSSACSAETFLSLNVSSGGGGDTAAARSAAEIGADDWGSIDREVSVTTLFVYDTPQTLAVLRLRRSTANPAARVWCSGFSVYADDEVIFESHTVAQCPAGTTLSSGAVPSIVFFTFDDSILNAFGGELLL